MGQTKHTPGPWKAIPEVLFHDGQHIAGRMPKVIREGVFIASVSRHDGARIKRGRCPEAEANARLIAASPDLLAALERLLQVASEGTSKGRALDLLPPGTIDKARAAIAKATKGD